MDRENSWRGGGGSGFNGSGEQVTGASTASSSGGAGGSEPPAPSLPDELFDYLAGVHAFDKAELQERFQRDLSDQEFGLLLHNVRERLRDELGVEFISRSFERPGFYFRADDNQKLNRGQQFSLTGLRKQQRAVRVLDAVNPDGLSDERRSVLQHARDKIGMAVVRAAQAMGLRRSVPTECEVPEVPRRGR